MRNRRRCDRVPVRVIGPIIVLGPDGEERSRFPSVALEDLSASGCRLSFPAGSPPDSAPQDDDILVMGFPQEADLAEDLRGRVVWAKDRPDGRLLAGVQFHDLPRAVRQRIDRFLGEPSSYVDSSDAKRYSRRRMRRQVRTAGVVAAALLLGVALVLLLAKIPDWLPREGSGGGQGGFFDGLIREEMQKRANEVQENVKSGKISKEEVEELKRKYMPGR